MPKAIGLATMALFLYSAAAVATAEVVKLPAPGAAGQEIALHCLKPKGTTHEAVLFIHGASFPTMLAAGFEFNGSDSWMDFAAKQGRLACGLDFLNYGASSRSPAMFAKPEGVAPLMRAPEAEKEIEAAAAYLAQKRGITRLHVIAHSWGTIPAAMYAAGKPKLLASLILFGPIVPVPGYREKPTDFAWWSITAQQRYRQLRFTDQLPPGVHLLETAVDRRWASEFAKSQPVRFKGTGDALRIPAGCIADIHDAKTGKYPYRQSDVTVPVMVVFGDYDDEVDDAGAKAFLGRFTSSSLKWRLRIDHGTHVMHLERNRWSLYRSVAAFIALADEPHR